MSYTVTMQHHTLLPVVSSYRATLNERATIARARLHGARFTVAMLGVESVTVRYVMPRLVVRPVT